MSLEQNFHWSLMNEPSGSILTGKRRTLKFFVQELVEEIELRACTSDARVITDLPFCFHMEMPLIWDKWVAFMLDLDPESIATYSAMIIPVRLITLLEYRNGLFSFFRLLVFLVVIQQQIVILKCFTPYGTCLVCVTLFKSVEYFCGRDVHKLFAVNISHLCGTEFVLLWFSADEPSWKEVSLLHTELCESWDYWWNVYKFMLLWFWLEIASRNRSD